MTQDEIIRMALEAGISSVWAEASTRQLERFAALVAAHEREKLHNEIATLQCDIEEMYSRADVDYLIGVEREACAKVCDKGWKEGIGAKYQGDVFAEAIRERGYK